MSSNPNETSAPIIACNPGAIHPNNRDSHIATAESIFSPGTILDVRELANGYGFRLPLETPMLYKAAEFIANERLCCSFFTFNLVVSEQLWLELSGTAEVKDYIQANIVQSLDTGRFPTTAELEAAYTEAVRGAT
jgi:hypothetical protein